MTKSLREGWIATEEKRSEVLQQLINIATDPETKERNRVMAIKAILAAERVSQGWADVEIRERMLEGGNGVNILAVINELHASLNSGSTALPEGGVRSLED